MRLHAVLKHVSGSKRHVAVMVGRGGVATMPDPVALRILPDGAGYSLLRIAKDGTSVAHTWHRDVDDAKAAAARAYGVAEDEWTEEPRSAPPPADGPDKA